MRCVKMVFFSGYDRFYGLVINFTSVFLVIQRFKNHEIFENLKVGFSHFKKIVFFASERSLKLKKSAFYFILKALFVFKIFKCLS